MGKETKELSQEWWFEQWLIEAQRNGIVLEFGRAERFELYPGLTVTRAIKKTLYKGTSREREKIEYKNMRILNKLTYEPDYVVIWNPKYEGTVFQETLGTLIKPYFRADKTPEGDFISYVDVKAPPGSGNKNSSDAALPSKKSIMWFVHGIYINKVYNMPNRANKPVEPYLFAATFTPERYLWTDKKTKMRSISKWKVVTCQDYLRRL